MKESEINHVEETKKINGNFVSNIQKSEINHCFENYWYINERWGKQIKDASTLKGEGSVIVCGSGPDLLDNVPLLKQWEGDIMCCNSQGPTLLYHGIEPTYIVEMDNRSLHKESPWEETNTKLILQPGCQHERFTKWPNEMYLYLMQDPNDIWRTRFLPVGFPWVKAKYLSFGTSGAMAVAMALHMGYDQIYLLGFGWGGFDTEKKNVRFNRVVFENNEWKEIEWPKEETPIGDVEMEGGGITSRPLIFQKTGFFSMLALELMGMGHKFKIATCSKIIRELPYFPLEKVVKRQGKIKHFWPLKKYEEYIEAYLMRHGKYIVRFHDGNQYGCLVYTSEDIDKDIDGLNKRLETQKKFFIDNPDKKPPNVDPEKIQVVDKTKYKEWLNHLEKVR